MKISEAFDLYKTNYMFYQHRSKRILENHEYVKHRLVKIVGDKPINKLNMDDVQLWATKSLEGRQWNTVRNDICRLRSVLKYLNNRDIRCLNPELIPVPKRQDVTRDFLTADEVACMVENACNLRAKFIISLLYSSGIRLSELLSLNKDDIIDRHFQVVGKGGKLRLCFIDERTEEYMRRYLASRNDNCEALVVNRVTKVRMTATNVQYLVKNAARMAGIDKHVTPHILRHSFATNFIENNGNIRYLCTMLGHRSVSTTMIYTHVVDKSLEEQYNLYHSF